MSDEPNGIAYPMSLFDNIKVDKINGIPASEIIDEIKSIMSIFPDIESVDGISIIRKAGESVE